MPERTDDPIELAARELYAVRLELTTDATADQGRSAWDSGVIDNGLVKESFRTMARAVLATAPPAPVSVQGDGRDGDLVWLRAEVERWWADAKEQASALIADAKPANANMRTGLGYRGNAFADVLRIIDHRLSPPSASPVEAEGGEGRRWWLALLDGEVTAFRYDPRSRGPLSLSCEVVEVIESPATPDKETAGDD